MATPPSKLISASDSNKVVALLHHPNYALREGGHRNQIDFKRLAAHLLEAGVEHALAFEANINRKERSRLIASGIQPVCAQNGVEDAIAAKAKKLVRAGFSLILVSGDSALGHRVQETAQAHDRKVSFWSLRSRASRSLTFSRFIDDLVCQPRRRNDYAWLNEQLCTSTTSASQARS